MLRFGIYAASLCPDLYLYQFTRPPVENISTVHMLLSATPEGVNKHGKGSHISIGHASVNSVQPV
jgi:hypothetical protein